MDRFSLGDSIREARNKRKLSQNVVARGICAVGTLSKIENGVMYPSGVKQLSLLERAGENPDHHIILLTKRETDFLKWIKLFENTYKRDLDTAGFMLKKIQECLNEGDNIECQMVELCQVRYSFAKKEIGADTALEKLKEALNYSQLNISSTNYNALCRSEWKCLLEVIHMSMYKGDNDLALRWVSFLNSYFEKADKSYLAIREGYEIALIRTVEILIAFGRYKEAEKVSNQLIETFSEFRSTRNLPETLINKTTIAIRTKKSPKDIEEIAKKTLLVVEMSKNKVLEIQFKDYLKKECVAYE